MSTKNKLMLFIFLLFPSVVFASCVTRTISTNDAQLTSKAGHIHYPENITIERSSTKCGIDKKARARREAAWAAAGTLLTTWTNIVEQGYLPQWLHACNYANHRIYKIRTKAYTGILGGAYVRYKYVEGGCLP